MVTLGSICMIRCMLCLQVENCVKPVLDDSPDPKILEDQDHKFHKMSGILDSRLAQNEWIAGNSPTIADIACAAPMYLNGRQKPP